VSEEARSGGRLDLINFLLNEGIDIDISNFIDSIQLKIWSRLEKLYLPNLRIEEILLWADEHKNRTRKWPTTHSGKVLGTIKEKWKNIDSCLFTGGRGLPRGSSLSKLLKEYHGHRNVKDLFDLTEEMILDWADQYFEINGKWPKKTSGKIIGTESETWKNIDNNLHMGHRGLNGRTTLAKLLFEQRGVLTFKHRSPLSKEIVLRWADKYHKETGEWPTLHSGAIEGTGENWKMINYYLRLGGRGLLGNSSLSELLYLHKGIRDKNKPPKLTSEEIIGWVEDHKKRTGEWPSIRSGEVLNQPEENWASISQALRVGIRGLPKGSSLAKLLYEKKNVLIGRSLPPYKIKEILAWADEYRSQTGEWPTIGSGEIPNKKGETWQKIEGALSKGRRGLPGGSSLAKLLKERRNKRMPSDLPPLSIDQILIWADMHKKEKGEWPTAKSGFVIGNEKEKWGNVEASLNRGARGSPKGMSIAKILAKYRNKRNRKALPKLTENTILKWADQYFDKIGKWPRENSGVIEDTEETWNTVTNALRAGIRGLKGGSSLARLLEKSRGVRSEKNPSVLIEKEITKWAEKHFKQTGKWPNKESGSVIDQPGETWNAIYISLRVGRRGLRKGLTLKNIFLKYSLLKT
jgi:hypothetical protein